MNSGDVTARFHEKGLSSWRSLEVELWNEKAAALGRTGSRLEAITARRKILRGELGQMVEKAHAHGASRPLLPAQLANRLVAWDVLSTAAQRLRDELIVQREALGLRRREDVEAHYPIPRLPVYPSAGGGEGVP